MYQEPIEEGDENEESSFFNHNDETVVNRPDNDDDDDDDDDGEDDDILVGLMEAGLTSIPDGKPKNSKRNPKQQIVRRDSLKNINVIDYIEKKMNGPNRDSENENEKKTQISENVFKIPDRVPDKAPDSSSVGKKKGNNCSAQYCNEVMNSDSIKPFNSGNNYNYKS